ncbi:MAG: superoxide dismutase [Dehalococcoidia bacterium]|nr:superoxide dismutase [Dehalococcoidia bacterium]
MPRVARDVKPAMEMEGISRRQIDEHYDVLYKGYVNKLNEIEAKIPASDMAEANATYSLIRELKKEEVFVTDAIRLHELYFENLGGDGRGCSGQILDLIKEDFGAYEKWEAELKALGVASRGWVVLAFDWADHKLHNYITDIHSEAVWDASALLILDVYEHAYFIDYGTARKKYLEAFVKNINWAAVNSRIERLRLAEIRKAHQS